jgi:predicted Zn-dependent protease
MSEANSFWDKFPDMRPVHSAPSLFTMHGIGTALVGSRDHDPDTGTYVKTRAFAVLFIPLLALGAYRVADAPGGGWYFLGKVPLSGFAKLWNLLLVLLVAGGGATLAWNAHTRSPEYAAGRKLEEADRLLASGQAQRAAGLYREVLTGNTSHAAAARDKLVTLMGALPEAPEEAAGVLRVALGLHRQNRDLVPDLYARGLALGEKHADADPRGALMVLEVIAPLAPKPQELLALRRKLLERLAASDPNDAELASRLAAVCYAQGELKRCEEVLAPHAARLGLLEGAALLGHLYAAQGKHDQALALLNPYLDGRLPRLHAAEKEYIEALDRVEKRALDQLKNGTAPGFDRARYRDAALAQQQQMLQDYRDKAVAEDPGVREAQEKLGAEAAVVPAALDLGMVLLHRAQGLADPDARKAELEKAEKTFLAIRGLAGESDQYRLHLGQVYYWLGKHGDGRRLFDDMLQGHNRSSEIVLAVASVLREVGAMSDARSLLEESYAKETDLRKKQELATLRGLTAIDLDDKIVWLGRADPADPDVRASLCSSRGQKVAEEGKDDEAAKHYREAIDVYGRVPENAAVLNNSALLHLALHRLTHDPDQLTRAIDKLDRAVALRPGDSILLHNVADALLESALDDVIGPSLDLKLLKRSAGLDLLPFLYRDVAERQKLVDKVRKHPGTLKARGYYEKMMVLAPKREDSYSRLAALHGFTRDLEGLRGVWRKLQGVELDQADEVRETMEFYAGKNDAKKIADWQKARARYEERVAAARKGGGATFAAAASGLVRTRIGQAALQPENADADALVRLAEEAHAAAPSSGTQSLLFSALWFRAHQSLAGADPAYRELADRTRRSLGSELLTWVVGREGPLRDKALAHPDVKRALTLKLEQVKAFPDEPGPTTWAELRFSHPEEAAQVAQATRTDPLDEVERSIGGALSPLSAGAALSAHWVLLMAGKGAEADEVLKKLAARGVPMPVAGK